MVSLRLSITISRHPSADSFNPHPNTYPYPHPSLTTPSLSHDNPHTHPPTYTTSTLPPYLPPHNESTQTLLPKNTTKKQVAGRYCTKEELLAQSAERKRKFEGQEREGVHEERRRSFGIGGAGNIRRPSDVIYPVRRESIVGNNGGDIAKRKKRRGSGWSMGVSDDAASSSLGKKGIWGFWRRGSDA